MNLISSIDIGNEVVCDFCNRTIESDEEKGGCFIDSYAVCPECAEDLKSSEDTPVEFISGSFRQAVLRKRNGNNRIEIWTE